MPKARMTALDVRAMVTDIKPLCLRLRVANVYDISSKVYVLKLSEGETKRHLVMQSGTRFHLSEWKRDKQSIPSVFTMRLRKYIRTKRMTDMRQLGFDRVLDMTFGHGEQAFHLIVEFYARGNVVLTDHEYIVKSSWRQFKSDDAYAVRLNEKYPVDEYEKVDGFLLPGLSWIFASGDRDRFLATISETLVQEKTALVESISQSLKNKERKEKQMCIDTDTILLEDLIAKLCPVAHKALVEHVMEELGIATDTRINMTDGSDRHDSIISILQRLIRVWYTLSTPEQKQLLCPAATDDSPSLDEPLTTTTSAASEGDAARGSIKGYILESSPGVYEDFSPIPLSRKAYREMPTFHECVDQYFSSVEVGKAEKAKTEKLTEIESKIEKIRTDQFERVERLKAERDLCEKQAVCVEYHISFVARALEMMQRLVQSGSDWSLIEKLVKEQRRNNHPVCAYVQSMQLKEGKFTLLLQDPMYGHNDEEKEITEDAPLIPVQLTIVDSAFQNIKNLHDAKKQSQAKFLKTEAAAHRVITQAEQAAAKLKKTKELSTEIRPQIRKIRKTFWFERFYWFVTSDGYLVLGGHDAIENEILYKKYLRKEDIFVHADVHGASTCIIRNAAGGEIPQTTLNEAGTFAVCRSNAWKTKVLVAAYWVYAHQVSKTPQAGEFVSTGGFIIRGQRNPIIVKKLEMGLGIYFHLGDDESIKRHYRASENCSGETTPASSSQKPPATFPELSGDKQKISTSGTAKSRRDMYNTTSRSSQQAHERLMTIAAPSEDQHSPSSSEVESVGGLEGAKSECSSESPTRAQDVDPTGHNEEEMEQKTSRQRTERGEATAPPVAKRPHSSHTSTRVQWGISEVLPTPAIPQRVEFDELPPEVIVVHSERSILSDDENHWILRREQIEDSLSDLQTMKRTVASQESSSSLETEEAQESCENDGTETKCQRRLPRESRRPDSADELPPPSTYLGRAAPKDLLAKRTPETAPMSQASESESDFDLDQGSFTSRAQTERQPHRSVPLITSPFRETLPAQSSACNRRRRRAVDGGPPPRGFLEFEVPPVRDLLRFGSKHSVYEDEDGSCKDGAKTAESAKSVMAFSSVSKAVCEGATALKAASMKRRERAQDTETYGGANTGNILMTIKDDEEGDAEGESSPLSAKEGASSKDGRKRMMSKAERKMLKRGKQGDLESDKKLLAASSEAPSLPGTPTDKKTQKTQPLPRGKRQKLKKMKKYEEQSDEEKEIAMKLIGAKKIRGVGPPEEEEQIQQEPQKSVWDRATAKPQEAPDRNIAEESEDEIENEEWKKRLEVLNELTGRPFPEDTVLSAIPVCAPYSALKSFIYKGRVLPGGGKKGLAVKHALQAFIEMSPAASVERELIRQISVDELSACLVGNPIVQIQGIDKVMKAEKQAKKMEKKVKREAMKE